MLNSCGAWHVSIQAHILGRAIVFISACSYLFYRHDDLHGVQAVEAEVVGEVCGARDLVSCYVSIFVWPEALTRRRC